MTPDQKLAFIARSLQDAGIETLVMGGHAVRYYGIDRNTADFDLVTSVATPDELRLRLPRIEALGPVREEPVWRSRDFARFEIGRLPDGREEWLEFWIRNHLLGDFKSLNARAEVGIYGGGQVAFLSIADLMRSKETQRESDWRDIALLEEIQDARHHAAIASKPDGLLRLLSHLRSRRGMDRAIEKNLLDDPDTIIQAVATSAHPVTYAFLLPLAGAAAPAALSVSVEPTSLAALSTVDFGSPKHFALIEICRRAYKRHAMEIDRADKQAKLDQNR